MENISPSHEIGPEIEKEETEKKKEQEARHEFKEFFESMDELLGFEVGIEEEIKKSEPLESQYGTKGNKLLEYNPETGKIVLYEDFLKLPKNNWVYPTAHLFGEIAISKGIINPDECKEKLSDELKEFESSWILDLKKPDEISDEDWQKYLINQKIAERFAAFFMAPINKREMVKERLARMSKTSQAKLLQNKDLQKKFIEETETFEKLFSQALEESRKRGEKEVNREIKNLLQEEQVEEQPGQRPQKKANKIAEGEQVAQKQGFFENVLDEIGALWQILMKGKTTDEKTKNQKIQISWLGKIVMNIFEWFETRKAYQKKILDTCEQWALQEKMRGLVIKDDEGIKADPVENRAKVRFHKLASESGRSWLVEGDIDGLVHFLDLEKFTNKLHNKKYGLGFDIEEYIKQRTAERDETDKIRENKKTKAKEMTETLKSASFKDTELKKAEEIIDELTEHVIFKFWAQTQDEADIGDYAGAIAGLRAKAARQGPQGIKALQAIYEIDLVLWKLLSDPRTWEIIKKKPGEKWKAYKNVDPQRQAEKFKDRIPRIELGLIGSHSFTKSMTDDEGKEIPGTALDNTLNKFAERSIAGRRMLYFPEEEEFEMVE